MQKGFVGLIAVTIIAISNIAFATDTTTLNLTFQNNTNRTGYAVVDPNNGPIVGRLGGNAQWTVTVKNKLTLLGLAFAGGATDYCINEAGNVVINPANYIGDTITITYTGYPNGDLYCECSGSVCDVSMVKKKS